METRDYSLEEPAPSTFTAAYVARTLRDYRGMIGLIVLAVAVGYVILGILAYLLSPSLRVTSLGFRLEFAGAEKGQYPNGSRFASSEILSTPVLLKTFKQNDLQRFTQYDTFSSSLYVVESNEAREALGREYQARLADPRLTSIDRERIQREYELKAGSLTKNQFSVNYARRRGDSVPDAMAKKILHDTLRNWAEYASNEQHVLEHRVTVLSPDVVAPDVTDTRNPIVNTIILRGNVGRLIENINELNDLPNAEVTRTRDGLSLNDISVRLEDAVRYRLDPLVARIAAARLDDRAETLRFLSTQLAYDERTLQMKRVAADTIQQTFNLYVNAQPQRSGAATTATATPADEPAKNGGETSTLMPQIGEGFLDRLIQLTARTGDSEFRQTLTDEYRKRALIIAPAEATVAYDREALASVRNMTGAATQIDAAQVEREIETTRTGVRALAVKVQELHKVISQNLNPATELVTAGTPQTRVHRAVSVKTLFLIGVVLLLISLVVSVLLALVLSRVHAEDTEHGSIGAPAEGAA